MSTQHKNRVPSTNTSLKRTNKSKAPPIAFQKKEILKCGRDPIYFINTYCKISEPVKGLIPFQTFPYQDECVEEFKNNQFVIVNKSRQLGLSTVCAAYALWLCIFHKEKNVLIIATKLEVAKNFQAKVFTMFDNLPKWLVMPSVVQRSIKTLKFSNGSKIQAVPTSPDAGRGEALSLLLVDECISPSTYVKIRHKKTGEIKLVHIEDIYTNSEFR